MRPLRAHPEVWVVVGLTALLVVLGYFYLLPASQHAVRGDTGHILTDGGDAVTAPTAYWMMADAVARDPARLLYGTVYTEQLNPPEGFGLWMPWQDRLLVIPFAALFPIELSTTLLSWALMVLNGLAFYAFGRVEGWRRPIAAALGIAFAFSVYTRARAFVHPSLVGLFGLPLAFVALRLVQRARGWRALILPAVLLLGCAAGAHYYILMTAAVSPLLLWFFLRDLPAGERLRGLGRVVLVALPAILFLGWNLAVPLPAAQRSKQAVFRPPVMGKWLYEFGSRPSDYLVGDIAEKKDEAKDLNPLRAKLSRYVQKNVLPSNHHERSNGIRWSILAGALVLAAAMLAPRRRDKLPAALRHAASFYLIFAAATFLLSLPPSAVQLETDLGPSRWVHALFENFRVPSRFGAYAHFGVLAAVGWGLSALFDRWRVWARPRTAWAATLLLPALMVLDYPPLVRLPMAVPAPTLAALEKDGAPCGAGVFFPYTASNPAFEREIELYRALQRIRGTRCALLDAPLYDDTIKRLIATLGFRAYAANRAAAEQRLVAFARCTHLSWLAFFDEVPKASRDQLCRELGFEFVAPDLCRAPAGPAPAPLVAPAGCVPP